MSAGSLGQLLTSFPKREYPLQAKDIPDEEVVLL